VLQWRVWPIVGERDQVIGMRWSYPLEVVQIRINCPFARLVPSERVEGDRDPLDRIQNEVAFRESQCFVDQQMKNSF
jgi:hypothetical protein